MTYEGLIELLLSSSGEDWLRDSEKGASTSKRDLHVTVRKRDEEPGTLDEPWALFRHNPAVICIFELWYGASHVNHYYFASVDGGRALLPYPRSRDNLTITRVQLAIAIAVNENTSQLHSCLHETGIRVDQV